MRYKYDESASDVLPTHLFEWATGADVAGCDVASKVITEAAEAAKRRKSERRDVNTGRRDALSDIGVAAVEALSADGFDADFAIAGGRVDITFEDAEGVFNSRRGRQAHRIISEVCRQRNGIVNEAVKTKFASGGTITAGIMGGVGFSNASGIDTGFDPFIASDVCIAEDIDANVSDGVIDRLNELAAMWDGPYDDYAEGVDITLNEMTVSERDTLKNWIELNVNSVGIPGTTLEEVLVDIHNRIGRSQRDDEA